MGISAIFCGHLSYAERWLGMNKILIFTLLSSLILLSCAKEGQIDLGSLGRGVSPAAGQNGSSASGGAGTGGSGFVNNAGITVTGITHVGHEFRVSGTNLHTVDLIKVQTPSMSKNLNIVSKSPSLLVTNIIDLPGLSLIVSKI